MWVVQEGGSGCVPALGSAVRYVSPGHLERPAPGRGRRALIPQHAPFSRGENLIEVRVSFAISHNKGFAWVLCQARLLLG